MTKARAIELTIPRTPGRDLMPFCHCCMRAVESFTVDHEMHEIWNGPHLIAREPTGGMTLEIKCHGEEWHAFLGGDGKWHVRAVA